MLFKYKILDSTIKVYNKIFLHIKYIVTVIYKMFYMLYFIFKISFLVKVYCY